jgi:hypothetical protein
MAHMHELLVGAAVGFILVVAALGWVYLIGCCWAWLRRMWQGGP